MHSLSDLALAGTFDQDRRAVRLGAPLRLQLFRRSHDEG